MFGSAHAQPSKQNWYLGEGLGVGDEFVYEVCDFVLRIPESPDHCYAYQKQTRNCRRDATSLHINNGLICFKDLFHHSMDFFDHTSGLYNFTEPHFKRNKYLRLGIKHK
jgi:hypothetical protein